MKWYKTNDVIEGLFRHGFEQQELTARNVFLYHHGSGSRVVIPIITEELSETLLLLLLPKAHLDLASILEPLEVREAARIVPTDTATTSDASLGPKTIVEQPQGTTVDLSSLNQEEIDGLARDSRGMWRDHPLIKDSVEWVREIRVGLYRSVPEG